MSLVINAFDSDPLSICEARYVFINVPYWYTFYTTFYYVVCCGILLNCI